MPNTTVVSAESGIGRTDIDKPLKWLRERDYINGVVVWGGSLIEMRTTPKGQNIIEYEKSVRGVENPQQPPTVSISNNTTNGSINQQVGNNNEQNIHIGINSENVDELVEALNLGGREDLADEVKTATDDGRNPGAVGRALAVVIPALASTAELGTAAATIGGWFA